MRILTPFGAGGVALGLIGCFPAIMKNAKIGGFHSGGFGGGSSETVELTVVGRS